MKRLKKVLATFAAVAVSLGMLSASMVEAQSPPQKKNYRTHRHIKQHPRKVRRIKKHHRHAHKVKKHQGWKVKKHQRHGHKVKKHNHRVHKHPAKHTRRPFVKKYRYPKGFNHKRLTTRSAI